MSEQDLRGSQENSGAGFEERDTDARVISRFGIALGGIVIVACFTIWFVFDQFAAREKARSAEPSSLVQQQGATQPPAPRLQANPPAELRQFREDEDAVFNTYGWVDPQHGVVRIPVSRAMDLAAERGLKAVRK
jgi:hypothetical protein